MKNDYEVRGEITIIFIIREDGSKLETIIDTADLERANEFEGRWFASNQQDRICVHGHTRGNKRTVILSRWLFGEPEGIYIDYQTEDTLNNRRNNFIQLSKSGYGLNREKANKNNRSSGIVGVTWHKQAQKWCAQIMHNRKNMYLGLHETIEDAEKTVKEVREKLLGKELA